MKKSVKLGMVSVEAFGGGVSEDSDDPSEEERGGGQDLTCCQPCHLSA